ncbi:UNVERIFIED_CONTAM: hypothetical protein ABID98_001172 [Brevibacillus sp. OAP136]
MDNMAASPSFGRGPGSLLPMNRPEAIARCQHLPTLRQLLRMNGIPVLREQDQSESIPMRRYRMLVHQFRVVKVWLAEGKSVWLDTMSALPQPLRFEEVPDHQDNTEIKKIEPMAIRSIYAVGLDVGIVEIAAMSEFRQAVITIRVDEASIEPYTSFLRQLQEEWEQQQLEALLRQSEVVLGADPEFALRDPSGQMAFASRYVGRSGTIGYDAVRFREKPSALLHPLVELRPKPSADPNELFVEMYRTMRLAATKKIAPELEWIAGGMPFDGYPIGGHIHFSGIALNASFVRKLDTYLALPLMLLEDGGCQRRRPRYGFFGDVREKSYGGFEYRTLPSWLVTPRVAKGILALAKVVATHHRELRQDPLRRILVQSAYYQGDKTTIRPIVRGLWRELSLLSTYQTYRQSLDPFFAEAISAAAWFADEDFRPAWRLTVPSTTDDEDAIAVI